MSIYKTSILILVILALSLFIGCDNLKSKELSPEKKLELAEKCSNAGKEYFKDFVRRNHSEGILWDDPEYHYNSRLNTCIIHIRYIDPTHTGLSFHYNQVIDVFSNKTILYGRFARDSEKNTETVMDTGTHGVPNYTSGEYFKQKDKLFSE